MVSTMKIFQMAPHYNYGDAIGNSISAIRKFLADSGYETGVFVDKADKRLEALPFTEYLKMADDDSWLIYHFSTGSRVNQFVLEHGRNVILIYHNITPASYFEPYAPKTAALCREGRAKLPHFANKVKLAAGDSLFNIEELIELGFADPVVTPLILNINRKTRPTAGEVFNDDKTNILYVGRIAPNKRIEDLIKVFYFYKNYVDNNSRLVIVGGYHPREKYYHSVKGLAKRLNLSDVYFAGSVSDEKLNSYFAAADVYLSLSLHEGFCVPLLEAMSHDLPVVALGVTAVPETLGDTGVMVNDMKPDKIAELIGLLVEDDNLRGKIIESQKRRLDYFDRDKALEKFKETLELAFSRK